MSINPLIVSLQSGEFLLSLKIQGNSKCHAITVTKNRLKTSRINFIFFNNNLIFLLLMSSERVFFLLIYVFWPAKFKSDVNFCWARQENLYNREFFSVLWLLDSAAGFPCGRLRWDSFSAFGASLRPSLFAIGATAPPKASLWSGENNQLHSFSSRMK